MTTDVLNLEELAESQASKHVTHNEALRKIEAMLVRVLSRSVDAPPGSPSAGDTHIVGAAAFAIVAVDTTNDIVEVAGDQTGRIGTNDTIHIEGSTGNDGSYTVSAITYNSTSGNTEITLGTSIGDATADGDVLHSDGVWNGHRNEIAHYYGGSWHFYLPPTGLRIVVNDEGAAVRWTGSAWIEDPARPRLPSRTVSADYTVQTSDRGAVLLVDTSGGPVTITLLAVASAGADFPVAIVKATDDTNTVTIAPDGSETVEWASSKTLEDRGSGTLIVSDGSANWVAVGGGGGAGLPLTDDDDLFANDADETKVLRFALSALTTGTTRTATWPDKDGTVAMISDITGGGIASDELGEDSGNTSGLTWAYNAGSIRAGNAITEVPAGDVSLTASATNYVEVDPATGTVSVNTSGFTAGRIPLRELVTDGSGITGNTDRRAWLHGRIVFYTGLTETLPCNDQVVERPRIKDYAETRDTPSSSSGALTVDLEEGNVAEVTLIEDTSIDFANPPVAGQAGSLTLILKQDDTGGWAVTWPSSVQWPGGSAPSLSTSADAVDVLTFVTTDGGTTWYGFLAGAGMA